MSFFISAILETEMNPTNINFLKCAKLLTICRDQNKLQYKTSDIDLINEAISKLKLLHIIIKQLKHDEEKERQRTQKNLPILLTSKVLPEKYFVSVYTQRTVIFTYSFYYLAFRVYDILRTVTKLRVSAPGIVTVRNHLMEHPEGKSSRILSYGFGHIGPYGPTVKPGRNQNEKPIHMDKGLYHNAKEFETSLLKSLSEC
jgi:hypothetical protein